MIVEFHYGALADPLEEQANKQGLTLGLNASDLQNSADAVDQLYIAGVLTDAMKSKTQERLHKQVLKALKPKVTE